MKIKASEATTTQLDWLVAKALVIGTDYDPEFGWDDETDESVWLPYSTDWALGGPISEREEIGAYMDSLPCRDWIARKGKVFIHGKTELVAKMRCFVVGKLGDEVDVPKELT